MREVLIEVRTRSGHFARVATLSESDHPGSISSDEASGRQVYLFGFVDGRPGVWRSELGIDRATPTTRVIESTNFVFLADLERGPYELTRHKTGHPPMDLRFSAHG